MLIVIDVWQGSRVWFWFLNSKAKMTFIENFVLSFKPHIQTVAQWWISKFVIVKLKRSAKKDLITIVSDNS